MAGEPVFVDTNVLVYASRERSPFHAPATAWLRHASNEGTALWLSRHDANIAATMQAEGIRRLLTFNVADFRRFAGLIEPVAP